MAKSDPSNPNKSYTAFAFYVAGIPTIQMPQTGQATYNGSMVGVVNNRMHYTPLEKAVKAKQKISEDWLKIVKILAS